MVEAGVGFALLDPVAAYPFRNSTIWFAQFEPRITFRFFAYRLDGRMLKFDISRIFELARRRCGAVDRVCTSAPEPARIRPRASG